MSTRSDLPAAGDLEPPAVLPLSGAAGDLNTVTSWQVIGRHENGTLLVDNTDPDIEVDPEDSTKATVTHTWDAGETELSGVVKMWVRVLYPGTPPRPQTFGPVEVYVGGDVTMTP